MSLHYEDEQTIPNVTRNDGFKTGLYTFIGLTIAILLIFGTIWLFIAS